MREGAEATPRRRRRGRWVWRFLLGAGLLAGLLVALGIGRLSLGPVPIGVAARQAQTILQILVGREGKAEVASATLGWRADQSFVVELAGVTIAGPAGTASVPSVIIDIDLDALLFTGRLRAHGLTVERPSVALAPLSGGDLAIPEPVAFLDLVEERLARVAVLAREQGIERVAIKNGSVVLPRSGTAGPLSVGEVDIVAGTSAIGDVSLKATAAVGTEVWSADMIRRTDASGSVIDGRVDGVGLADLLGTDGVSRDLKVGSRAEARFSPTGDVTAATLSLSMGGGALRLGGLDDVVLARAEINLAWRPEAGDFALTPSPIVLDGLELLLAGTVRAPDPANPAWRFQLTVPRAQMAPPDMPGPPAVVETATTTGSFDPATLTIHFDSFEASARNGAIAGRASVYIGPGGPKMKMSAGLTAPADYATFLRVWPRFVVAPARKWLVDNVRAGTMTSASIAVDLGPADFDNDPRTKQHGTQPTDVSFAFEGAEIRLPGAMPPLSGATGEGTIRGPTLSVDVGAGTIAPAGRPPAALEKARLVIPDLDARPLVNEIEVTLSGSAASVAVIAEAEPLRAMSHLHVTPSALSGNVSVDLSLKGPIDNPFEPSKLDWSVRATLDDVSSSVPIDGRTIGKADVVITADASGMTTKGKALIDGITANVDMTQPFGAGAAAGSDVTFVLTDADRKAKGVDLGGLLTGPIGVTLEAGEGGAQRVEVDLDKATVTLPGIGWTKGAGVEATATFTLTPSKDGGYRVDKLTAVSDGVDVAGSLAVDKSGGLVSADFTRFALRPGDSASLLVKRGVRNGYVVTVSAKRLDGRGLIRQLKSGSRRPGEAKGGVPFDVTASIGNLVGYGGVALDDVDLTVAGAQGRIDRMRFAATTESSAAAVSARIEGDGGGRSLVLSSDDTGRLLRFLDVYSRMGGGQGRLTATIGPTVTEGNVTVRDFRIAEEPKLNRLMSTASNRSPAGARDQSAPPPPSTSGFDRMAIRFSLAGDTLTINDAVLRGPSSGGSATGTIRLDTGRMTLTGTFIPIYALNNLFGRIPVVGEILGAGRNGGLFGVTFRLDGPIDDPAMTFNPISSLTPGIFRRIFEYQ
jgi:hypothetical protein